MERETAVDRTFLHLNEVVEKLQILKEGENNGVLVSLPMCQSLITAFHAVSIYCIVYLILRNGFFYSLDAGVKRRRSHPFE